MAFVLIVVISLPLGILCARYEGGVVDRVVTVLDQITMSIPNFLLGFVLTYVFSLVLHWVHRGRFSSAAEQGVGAYLGYLFFPALAIALPKAAMTVKMLRGSILGEMREDYSEPPTPRATPRGAVLLALCPAQRHDPHHHLPGHDHRGHRGRLHRGGGRSSP